MSNLPLYTKELIHEDLVRTIYIPDIEEHAHIFWEISVILPNSSKQHVINGKSMDTSGGLISILRPNKDRHFIRTEGEVLYNHYDIYVFADKMEKLCQLLDDALFQSLFNQESAPCLIPNALNIDMITSDVNFIKKNQMNLESSATVRHSSLIAYILGLYVTKQNNETSIPDWIENIIRQIEQVEDFSCFKLTDLLRSVHYTHEHVSREFKKHTNNTLIGYINQVKLERSLQLLTHNYKIIDIAQRLGYCSQSAFENAFKKSFKTTPGKWRKQVKF